MRPARYIVNFDSAAAMLRATARFLEGKDFPGAGMSPPLPILGTAVNALPRSVKQTLYKWGGWGEAIRPRDLARVDAEDLAGWVVKQYPQGRYPVVAIGSSSGALVHLCAALRIPWLPQTFLIGVREHRVHPDEPRDALEAAKEPARALLHANPHLQLHHMHDPNQDRLMIQHMMYFRVKRMRLGHQFESFLNERLTPGGTILVAQCRQSWPTTQMGDRHIFQMGAVGGVASDEIFSGSDRISAFLERQGSHRLEWDPPDADEDRPEAEWGFEPALEDDIERFARAAGYRVRRLSFDEPDDLSPFVADLYRFWYRSRGMPGNRLLVESFVVLDPYWALRTGSVPLWMKFNVDSDAESVEEYLDGAEPYDEINMMLFSHGVDSVGLAPIDRWRPILRRATSQGRFIGVDEKTYPRDFGVFTSYTRELQRRIEARHPLPRPLELADVDEFYSGSRGRYRVEWTS